MSKQVLNRLKNNIGNILIISCSIISLIISVKTYVDQRNFKNSYNKSAQQVLMNAEDIEVTDIDNIFDLVYQSNNVPITNSEINVFIDHMQSNYNVVQQLKVTNFPNNQALNYQILRLNMQSDIGALQKVFEPYKKVKGQYMIKGREKKLMLKLLSSMRQDNRRDRKTIKNGQRLKDSTLIKSDSNFYKAYKHELNNLK